MSDIEANGTVPSFVASQDVAAAAPKQRRKRRTAAEMAADGSRPAKVESTEGLVAKLRAREAWLSGAIGESDALRKELVVVRAALHAIDAALTEKVETKASKK